MSDTSDDDLIYAVSSVKEAVDSVESRTEEVWAATRRLDDAISGPGGVLSHIDTTNAMLKKIIWILVALLCVSILQFLK